MKIPVIFIATVVAVGALRPPRAFKTESYRDFPSYVESPTPPLSRPSFLRSSSRHESSLRYFNRPQSFNEEESEIFSEGSLSRPPYREGHIFFADSPFSSSYFPPSRPLSLRWEGPTDFREGQVISYEYKGPPPPVPAKDSRIKAVGIVDKDPNIDSNNDLRTIKPKEEPNNQNQIKQQSQHQQPPQQYQPQQQNKQEYQPQHPQQYQQQYQPQQQNKHQYQPQQHHPTFQETKPLLSFGGHSNRPSFGNHGLGFASVAGITSADINPLAVAQNTATTKAATATALGTSASTISMQPSSTVDIKISQQHPSTNPTSYVSPTSATATSPSQKIAVAAAAAAAASAASSQAAESMPKDLAMTTPTTASKNPSVTTKLNSVSSQTISHHRNDGSTKYYESPKTTYDYRTVTQELPAPTHGMLPIESDKQHKLQFSGAKPSIYFYDTKPFTNEQFQEQIQQQLNNLHNNNNMSPVRFNIPTVPIAMNQATDQIKAALPPLDFSHSSLALTSVPNTYSSGQSHVDASQLKLNPTSMNAPSNPTYYFIQPQEAPKPAAPANSNIALGSFYLLPNTLEAKQPVQQPIQQPIQQSIQQPLQINTGISPGLQLQLSGYGGIQYFMSPSNSEQMRSVVIDAGKGVALQGQYQPTDSTLTKIGFAQNLW